LETAFLDLFGQIGATMVSIAFTLFVGYLLYVKEQRDRIKDRMAELRKEMSPIADQLAETPIPGVVHSLLSKRDTRGEKWDNLSITRWAAGVSWDMLVQVGEINENDVWKQVRTGLEDLVRGILPDGSIPAVETDPESFKKWGEEFILDTQHIEWFCHELGESSWVKSLARKMVEWEARHPNTLLRSQDVFLMIERISVLRSLVSEALSHEQNYERLKIENAIGHYRLIIAGFVAMGFFSIFVPLMMLLFPPVGQLYMISVRGYDLLVDARYVSLASLICFLSLSLSIMWSLLKTAKK